MKKDFDAWNAQKKILDTEKHSKGRTFVKGGLWYNQPDEKRFSEVAYEERIFAG